MMRQFELVERVKSYDPAADEEMLNRAYVYAMKKHGAQRRASGDPYFSHPIEVAGILTQYKLDGSSIATALLHDVIEDTDATPQELERLFGEEVARLVDGVTKLTRIEMQSDRSNQAENFRKLLLAMSQDIRVLLVKLADRLHNMRTLQHIPKPEKRRRIALETMEIYAPLAERIGMQELKTELEERAFAELHPDERASILTRLDYLRQQGGDLIPAIITELKQALEQDGIHAVLSGREKRPFSIWQKMQRKHVGFEQLSDIMAFRVVVNSVEECYRALGAIHGRYPMIPSRFKDYLSTPKANGYRSIHTAVIGPRKQRIEVQIRTHELHEIAELGVAAHWKYKQADRNVDGRQYDWVRQLLEILENAASPEEFLEHTKLQMFSDQVFCFTPKGQLIGLPAGATPVDFAYAVHTQVGNSCVGARVNGRMVPLRTVLINGDQVEIITSRAQTPSPEWERFVVTGKARSEIRRFLRGQHRDQAVQNGRNILQKVFRAEGVELTEKGLEGVLKRFRASSVDELLAQVGDGQHTGHEVLNAVYPAPKPDGGVILQAPPPRRTGKERPSFPIRGLDSTMAIQFAGCCHPLPGDRIVGIVHSGRGVTIHTIDCGQLEEFADTPERWLDLGWEEDRDGLMGTHIGRLTLVVANENDGIAGLLKILARNQARLANLKVTYRSADFSDLLVDLEVRDVKHLTNITAALRASPGINSVERSGH